jgi:hypothetical protein
VRSLLVVSVLLEKLFTGTERIATQMETVIDLISTDSEVSDLFVSKIVQIGWSAEQRRTGQLLHFYIRDAIIYEVNSTFTRLPIDIECTDAVVAIKNTVDLANILEIGVYDAIEAVSNAHH